MHDTDPRYYALLILWRVAIRLGVMLCPLAVAAAVCERAYRKRGRPLRGLLGHLAGRLGALSLGTSAVVLTVEYFWRKAIWWRVPPLRFMHMSLAREGGLAVFDRECYVTFLAPFGHLLLVTGGVSILVALARTY